MAFSSGGGRQLQRPSRRCAIAAANASAPGAARPGVGRRRCRAAVAYRSSYMCLSLHKQATATTRRAAFLATRPCCFSLVTLFKASGNTCLKADRTAGVGQGGAPGPRRAFCFRVFQVYSGWVRFSPPTEFLRRNNMVILCRHTRSALGMSTRCRDMQLDSSVWELPFSQSNSTASGISKACARPRRFRMLMFVSPRSNRLM